LEPFSRLAKALQPFCFTCATTGAARHNAPIFDRMEAGIGPVDRRELHGAGDRARTGDFDLGKVALYQLSYARPE
jgi:hypothetical protein